MDDAAQATVQLFRSDALQNVADLRAAGLVVPDSRRSVRAGRSTTVAPTTRSRADGVTGREAACGLAHVVSEFVGLDRGQVDFLSFPTTFSTVDLDAQPPLDLMRFVNCVPQVDPRFSPAARRLDDAWDALLDEAQPAEIELDAHAQAQLDAAEELLFADVDGTTPSAQLEHYRKLLAEWLNALEELGELRLGETEQLKIDVASERVRRAEDALAVDGRRQQIEQALDDLRRLGRRGPAATFARARSLRAAMQGLTDARDTSVLPETGFAPPPDDLAWRPISLGPDDIDELVSGTPDALGGLDLEAEILGHQSNDPVAQVDADFVYIHVIRPWIDDSILTSRAWRLPPGRPPFSDGGMPPEGRLVAYITGVVLLRNVRTVRLVRTNPPAADEPVATRGRRRPTTSAPARDSSSRRRVRDHRTRDESTAPSRGRPRARTPDRRAPVVDHRTSSRPRSSETVQSGSRRRSVVEPQTRIGHERPTIVAVACLTVPTCPDPDPQLFRTGTPPTSETEVT